MRSDQELLFSKYVPSSVMENQVSLMKKEIENYQPNKLLNTSENDLINYFASKM